MPQVIESDGGKIMEYSADETQPTVQVVQPMSGKEQIRDRNADYPAGNFSE